MEQELDKKTAKDVVLSVAYEFEWRQAWVEFFIALFQILLAFLFLKLICRSDKL